MIKAFIEFAIGAVIVVGTVTMIYAGYTWMNHKIYDPSLPHNELWRSVFGN